MKDVFRKLAELLGMDKQNPSSEEEQRIEPRRELREDIRVRTKVIYPQNNHTQVGAHFRFPIIPDEVLQESPIREKHPRQKVSSQVQVTNTKQPRIEKKIDKKPFKPTEVVSPVYGRMDPRLNTESNPKEKMVPSSVPTPVKDWSTSTDFTTDISQENINVPSLKQEVSQSELSIENKGLTEKQIAHVPEEEIVEVVGEIEEKDYIQPRKEVSATHVASNIVAFPRREMIQQHTPISIITNESIPSPIETPVFSVVQPQNKITQEDLDTEVTSSHAVSIQYDHLNQENKHGKQYRFPSLHFLKEEPTLSWEEEDQSERQIEKLVVALENFSVKADVIGVVKGPTVTRYELQPAPGVKVNKFTNLIDDIKLALAAKDIRMEAPIPGRSAIGIEVPNEVSKPVYIRSVLESDEFLTHPSPLAIALGRDISGAPVVGDLKKMPHGMIAGSTGSGKSVCVNSIIISLLYKATPEDVRLILIDPKVVELAPYNHIPHLLTPVVTDPKQATAALKWAVEEMDARYEKFAETGSRDIERYNQIALREGKEKLPYIVIVIDELADLMMVSPHDVEESICRIAQKARACGIHLLVATQRPSVDVITGLIKANIPTRIAFAVSSQADSRTILDMSGAERLLGKGDMLYYPSGMAKPVRLQGNFVSDDEIEQVIDHVKAQQKTVYLFDKDDLTRAASNPVENDDELFEEALMFVIEQGQASSSSLQRRFRIGYNRAARLVDMMEAEGFISGQSGSKPRDVLITMDDYRNLFG